MREPVDKNVNSEDANSGRRNFLKTAAVVGAGMGAVGARPASSTVPVPQDQEPVDPSKMPMTKIGHLPVSRLVVGANPFWGFSHNGRLMNLLMTEYYTHDQVVKVLQHCEECGINTWQTSFVSTHQNLEYPNKRVVEAWRALKESGSKMNVVVLVTANDFDDPRAWKLLLEMKPAAIISHGSVTDRHYGQKTMGELRDILKRFRDAGCLVGCSTHTPEVLPYIDGEDWDVDFFMGSLYRPSGGFRKQYFTSLPGEPLHEMYLEKAADLMCEAIRQVRRPVFAYKVLATGRLANSTSQIDQAIKYAFDNIKKTDGVIIGMFPKFTDQVAQTAHMVIKHGQI